MLEHICSYRVESVVVNLEDFFHLELMIVQLFDERFFFLHVHLLQGHELLLKVVAYGGQDPILCVALVQRLALAAVERLIDCTVELDLVAPMLWAVELLRIE